MKVTKNVMQKTSKILNKKPRICLLLTASITWYGPQRKTGAGGKRHRQGPSTQDHYAKVRSSQAYCSKQRAIKELALYPWLGIVIKNSYSILFIFYYHYFYLYVWMSLSVESVHMSTVFTDTGRGLLLASYRPRYCLPSGGTTHNGLACPHQPLIKKFSQRLAHRPIWWGYFLNGVSLFSNNSSLCHVHIN